MDEPGRVAVRQRLQQLDGEVESRISADGTIPAQQGAQRLPGDELHHDVRSGDPGGEVFSSTGVEHAHHARVIESCCGRLGLEQASGVLVASETLR